jgi:hypothetical protein
MEIARLTKIFPGPISRCFSFLQLRQPGPILDRLTYQNPMSEPEKTAGITRKWCPLCCEWKVATVLVSDSKDTVLTESRREIIYCPECGAMLRDDPKEKPSTGG